MVANHNSFQSRASIHEIAKVYGLTEAEITTITKRLGGGYGWLGIPVTEHPALADHGFSHPWPEILALAQRLEDIPRHLSVHCGGVVITPQPTSNWVPTQVAAKGVRIVHWEKDQTEDSGLVKIDLLGNRSLAVIRDAKEAAKKHHNVLIDYNQDNPIDDPATQALMASGDTMGVFYVESPSARMLQKKAAMGDYEHLVLHTSIIRPAANKFINLYLERLKGAHWEPLHPAIGDILDENYGLMIYQEDVTRVAMRLAGFPHAEADELRKILSQKHKKRRLKELMEQFYAGAAEQGASREQIDQIWEMIMSFAGYSFCKPHSASYALVSYQSGWLKAHFPAEFIAAVLSNQGGYYAAFAYVSEAKRMGLSVQPPDINLSDIRYSGADDWLRIGLMQIKGLSNLTMERIVLERMSNGNYRSMDDCISRVGLTETETELLIKAGCFDRIEVGRTRPELLWEAIAIDHHSGYDQRRAKRVIGSNSYSEQSQLFDDEIEVDVLPKPPQYNARTLLQAEIETLGFLVSCHPLDLYKDRLKSRPVVPASELGRCDRQHVEVAGWLVTSKLVLTKYRDPMEFVTFEDTTGLIETVFFPETFKRFSHILSYTRPYRLSGQVNIEHSVITLNVDRVEFL
jgi:DNA polymerase III alpha subunit